MVLAQRGHAAGESGHGAVSLPPRGGNDPWWVLSLTGSDEAADCFLPFPVSLGRGCLGIGELVTVSACGETPRAGGGAPILVVREMLNRAGRHAGKCRGDAAQPGWFHGQRGGLGEPAASFALSDSERRADRRAACEVPGRDASRVNATCAASCPARSPGSAGPATAASTRARP